MSVQKKPALTLATSNSLIHRFLTLTYTLSRPDMATRNTTILTSDLLSRLTIGSQSREIRNPMQSDGFHYTRCCITATAVPLTECWKKPVHYGESEINTLLPLPVKKNKNDDKPFPYSIYRKSTAVLTQLFLSSLPAGQIFSFLGNPFPRPVQLIRVYCETMVSYYFCKFINSPSNQSC